jgi:hypothetical protein
MVNDFEGYFLELFSSTAKPVGERDLKSLSILGGTDMRTIEKGSCDAFYP